MLVALDPVTTSLARQRPTTHTLTVFPFAILPGHLSCNHLCVFIKNLVYQPEVLSGTGVGCICVCLSLWHLGYELAM